MVTLKKGLLICKCRPVSRFISKRSLLNIFSPHCLKIAKLGTVDLAGVCVFSIDFQVTWSKVKVKLLVLAQMLSGQ